MFWGILNLAAVIYSLSLVPLGVLLARKANLNLNDFGFSELAIMPLTESVYNFWVVGFCLLEAIFFWRVTSFLNPLQNLMGMFGVVAFVGALFLGLATMIVSHRVNRPLHEKLAFVGFFAIVFGDISYGLLISKIFFIDGVMLIILGVAAVLLTIFMIKQRGIVSGKTELPAMLSVGVTNILLFTLLIYAGAS